MAQAGDNSQNIGTSSPGCYTKVFIRKGKTSSHMIYLGDYIGYPALWIDPMPFNATGTARRASASAGGQAGMVTRMGHDVRISGASVDNVVVYGIDGAVAARGGKKLDGAVVVPLSSLTAGTYLLTWREGISARCRYITVSR
jgi:hypothetical protein